MRRYNRCVARRNRSAQSSPLGIRVASPVAPRTLPTPMSDVSRNFACAGRGRRKRRGCTGVTARDDDSANHASARRSWRGLRRAASSFLLSETAEGKKRPRRKEATNLEVRQLDLVIAPHDVTRDRDDAPVQEDAVAERAFGLHVGHVRAAVLELPPERPRPRRRRRKSARRRRGGEFDVGAS